MPHPSPRPQTSPTLSPEMPAVHRVLYVEDQAVNVLLMQALLAQRPNVQLDIANSVEAGYRAALAEPPDLMLLDLRLPDGNGAQLLERLRAHPELAHVPAIAVTADHEIDLERTTFAELWAKPLDLRETLRRIDEFLARPPLTVLLPQTLS